MTKTSIAEDFSTPSQSHPEYAYPGETMQFIGDTEQRVTHPGMTLRDAFAMAALQGMCANPDYTTVNDTDRASDAYRTADEMLLQRMK